MLANRIRAIAARVFQVDEAQLGASSSPMSVPGWDSFGHLALVAAVEEEFGIAIAAPDIARMETLSHVEQVLRGAGVGS